jgi:hypothetical protein
MAPGPGRPAPDQLQRRTRLIACANHQAVVVFRWFPSTNAAGNCNARLDNSSCGSDFVWSLLPSRRQSATLGLGFKLKGAANLTLYQVKPSSRCKRCSDMRTRPSCAAPGHAMNLTTAWLHRPCEDRLTCCCSHSGLLPMLQRRVQNDLHSIP